MVTRLFMIITLTIMVSFLFNETGIAKPLIENSEDQKGEIYVKIYETLHCKKKPCDMQVTKILYEELLTLDTSPHARIGYANVLKHLAKTKVEKEKADILDRNAAYEFVFLCCNSDKVIAGLAKSLSTLYRIGIFFPPDLKQSHRWALIFQSYKEKNMYIMNE